MSVIPGELIQTTKHNSHLSHALRRENENTYADLPLGSPDATRCRQQRGQAPIGQWVDSVEFAVQYSGVEGLIAEEGRGERRNKWKLFYVTTATKTCFNNPFGSQFS